MKVFIKTYGCQMNERDSEALAGMFAERGFELTDGEEDADVLLFNTCSVREQAERKAIGKMNYMKKLKKRRPHILIGALGCMAQARGEKLFAEVPHLDFVVGTGELHKIPDLVARTLEEREHTALLDDDPEVLNAMGKHFHTVGKHPLAAQIAITRGCNRFCSYCIVPYVRGREISREIDDVLAEARMLADSGVREILLLGQNVAAFGLGGDTRAPAPDHSPFADLLAELAEIDGLRRIRFTSPYPTYFNDKLIDVIAREPKICRCIHLPLQSGSNRVLQAMNRQYSREQYLELVGKMRARIAPEPAFTTDVIVGFPGETDEDFAQTREVMEQVGFDNAYIFKYSPRPGTKSATQPDDVPQEVKEARNQLLLGDLERRALAHNRAFEGRTLEVFVEGVSRRNPARWSGRADNGKTVNFPFVEGVRPGDFAQVLVEHGSAASLLGKIIS